jgi:hypothetical protein
MTTKILEELKKLKEPQTRDSTKNPLNTEEVYAIREAIMKGHKAKDIAKACGIPTSTHLCYKIGVWALHNLPIGTKIR